MDLFAVIQKNSYNFYLPPKRNVMESKTIVINLAGSQEKNLSQDDLPEVQEINIISAAEPLFYVAKRTTGEIVGTAQYTHQDRRPVALLVAGWIASGLLVENRNYKQLAKDLREQNKAKEVQDIPAGGDALQSSQQT